MLDDFLTWWATQLASLAPARWRAVSGEAPQRRALVVAVRDLPPSGTPVVEVLARRRGGEDLLGRFVLDAAGLPSLRAIAGTWRAPVLLQLPPGLLLEQRVTLPLAAEREPERVLSYEMDRLTPFAAADLFWTWALDRRDRPAGRIYLRLSLVPKARLTPLLDALAAAGLRPVALDAPTLDGGVRRLALAQSRAGWWRRRGLAVAGGACAALAVAVAAVPFVQQSLAANRVEARIADLRPRANQAEALRRSLLDRTAATDVVQAQRARVGDALNVLATLTTLLPDDTYLTELTLRSRALVITGQSAAAARLIAAMAGDPAFLNPAFAAPVTRSDAGHNEGFSIRAEVAH